MIDLIPVAIGLLYLVGIVLFTPGLWAVKVRWLVSIALAGFWGFVLLRGGEVGLAVTVCIVGGLSLMVWGVGLGRWLLGRVRALVRWRPWWRLVAQYSRTARRRIGGHWEEYAESCGLIDGGWISHWHQVPVCHLAQPCRFQIAGVWGCGARCPLTRCEEWSHQVGQGDNLVGADDPNLALAVQIEEQRQQIEALFQEAEADLEAREAWRRSGGYRTPHWAPYGDRWGPTPGTDRLSRGAWGPSPGGYAGHTLLGPPPGGD